LLLLPLLLGLAVFGVYKLTAGKNPKPDSPLVGAGNVSNEGAGLGLSGERGRGTKGLKVKKGAEDDEFDPVKDAKHFVAMNTPRVEGLAYTAPKYDEITKPTTAPVPAMCIQFKGDCKCLSQQATPLDVKRSMCLEFARNGFFRDFDPDSDRKASERTAASLKVMEGRDKVLENNVPAGSQVAVFGNPPRDPPHQPAVAGIPAKGG
jgi:hypothetical protein